MDKDQKVTIKVTKKDIANGKRMWVDKCPIALAAQRLFGERMRMGASLLYEDGEPYYAIVPDEVQRWIVDFDTKKEVRPIQFTVRFNKAW